MYGDGAMRICTSLPNLKSLVVPHAVTVPVRPLRQRVFAEPLHYAVESVACVWLCCLATGTATSTTEDTGWLAYH